jgi:hypothetical protein
LYIALNLKGVKNTKLNTFTVNPQSRESCWVALDFNKNIIAEDKDPLKVDEKARKKTDKYSLSFVPKEGVTHIF